MSEITMPEVRWFKLPRRLRDKISLPRKEWQPHLANILSYIPPVDGEQRAITVCHDCGQFIGRRYIPYGLGQGVTINPCWCQLTGHRPVVTLLEITP